MVRNAVAETLGLVGKRLDSRRLRIALDDPDWVVRASAAQSLGGVGGRAAHRALIGVLRHDVHRVVRRDAAYALSFAADKSVAPVLEDALAVEQAEQARVGLLAALYALGQRRRLPDLLALLRSDAYQVRHAAMHAIEEVVLPSDCTAAVRSLREMLQREESPGLRVDAGHTLARLEAAAP